MNFIKIIPLLLLVVLSVVLMVMAIVDIIKSDIKNKAVLILLILFTGIFGCIFYFMFIKKRKTSFELNRNLNQ